MESISWISNSPVQTDSTELFINGSYADRSSASASTDRVHSFTPLIAVVRVYDPLRKWVLHPIHCISISLTASYVLPGPLSIVFSMAAPTTAAVIPFNGIAAFYHLASIFRRDRKLRRRPALRLRRKDSDAIRATDDLI